MQYAPSILQYTFSVFIILIMVSGSLYQALMSYTGRKKKATAIALICISLNVLAVQIFNILLGIKLRDSVILVIVYDVLYVTVRVLLAVCLYIILILGRMIRSISRMMRFILRRFMGPFDDILRFAWFIVRSSVSGRGHDTFDFAVSNNWKRDIRLVILLTIGINLPRITRYLLGILPSTSIITNSLDLISLVLATPKLFTPSNKKFLFEHKSLPLKIAFIALAPYLCIKISERTDYDLIDTISNINKTIPSQISIYMEFKTREFASMVKLYDKLLLSLTITSSVFLTIVIFLNSRVSIENEKEFSEKTLFLSIVIFAYSRALSMLG